jgi:hypothetical protein
MIIADAISKNYIKESEMINFSKSGCNTSFIFRRTQEKREIFIHKVLHPKVIFLT